MADVFDLTKFVNNDGFDKKLYFKLIKDTWETYPEIQYDTLIRDIQIDGDYASVQTYETALAVTHEQSEKVDAYGELRSNANSIYYLKKSGKKWQIVSEQVLSEKSQLKYGDARFIKMDLNAPRVTKLRIMIIKVKNILQNFLLIWQMTKAELHQLTNSL